MTPSEIFNLSEISGDSIVILEYFNNYYLIKLKTLLKLAKHSAQLSIYVLLTFTSSGLRNSLIYIFC